MYFDPKTPIGPFTLMEVRSLVGRLRCSGHVDGWVAQEFLEGVLGRPDADADEVVSVLIAHGFAEASSAGVRSTKLGNRLAASRLSKRLMRSTAERLLAEFLERLHAMNANDEFAYRVDKLVVFGSYLTDSPTLGDIDLGFDLEPRRADKDEHKAFCNARSMAAQEAGRHFPAFLDWLEWPRVEVCRALRASRRHLSFHRLAEVKRLGCPTRRLETDLNQRVLAL
ncbi:MAG: hypothetical protein RMA76_20245 [Deltaproteobacteria bacterium]